MLDNNIWKWPEHVVAAYNDAVLRLIKIRNERLRLKRQITETPNKLSCAFPREIVLIIWKEIDELLRIRQEKIEKTRF